MTTILGAAASGMVHNQTVIDAAANNVANAGSAAFKRVRPLAQGAPTPALPPEGGRLGVSGTTLDAIFVPGAPMRTDEPLHFAIADGAFLRVTDFDGASLYTRYGALALDAAGNVTASGGRLLDAPIAIPSGWSAPAVDANGVITARDEQGSVQQAGQLVLVRLVNPAGLESLGDGLYRETANTGAAVEGLPGDGAFAPLTVGALEGSNVDLAEELTQMIIAQRAYQACAKTFGIGDEMLALATNLTR